MLRCFFFNDTATTEIYTLSLHDALPIYTMRGGKMLNNWRMAQLHAQEAPERVQELEDWGALFDRTEDGLISQRDFGGHRYARLAHVGDRTGLELIRTLQQRTVALGIDVYIDRKSTRLNSSHANISYAVFCLKKKKNN